MNFEHSDRKKRLFQTPPEGTITVATYLASAAQASDFKWVAGRLFHVDAQGWTLSSDGEHLVGCWCPEIQRGGVNFVAPQPGDIVALKLARRLENSITCQEWKLLTEQIKSAREVASTGNGFSLQPVEQKEVAVLRAFMKLRQQLAEFFVARDFLEIRTPTLVPSPGLEPFLDPFVTELQVAGLCTSVYLPTSPEFHLKKALSRGLSRIFEMRDCFRNGELGDHHQAEFIMLEWYRAYAPLTHIIEDISELIEHVSDRPFISRTVTMSELWREVVGLDLRADTSVGELQAWCADLGLSVASDDDWNDLFFRLMVDKIEPVMAGLGPLFVTHFPPSQSALARLTGDGWADRFEFYWNGLEIANAFHELTDPVEQRRRFEIDLSKKAQLGKKAVAIDAEFLAALDLGLPPTSGVALGVDRLFMAIHNIRTIHETRLFPRR